MAVRNAGLLSLSLSSDQALRLRWIVRAGRTVLCIMSNSATHLLHGQIHPLLRLPELRRGV